MSAEREQPIRLVDLPPEQDLVGVAEMVRAAAAPLPEIAPAMRREIRDRLHDELRGARRTSFRRRHPVLVMAVVLLVGALGGAVVESAIAKWRASRSAPQAPPADPGAGVGRGSARRVALAPAAPVVEPEPALADDPPPAVVSETAPRQQPGPPGPRPRASATRASARAEVSPVQPTAPPALESEAVPVEQPPAARAEAALLAEAIRKLRVAGDAAGALALLDERRARF